MIVMYLRRHYSLLVALNSFANSRVKFTNRNKSFFSNIYAWRHTKDSLRRLDIALIICKLKRIFPLILFDSTEHLLIHFANETWLGGLMQYNVSIWKVYGKIKTFNEKQSQSRRTNLCSLLASWDNIFLFTLFQKLHIVIQQC